MSVRLSGQIRLENGKLCHIIHFTLKKNCYLNFCWPIETQSSLGLKVRIARTEKIFFYYFQLIFCLSGDETPELPGWTSMDLLREPTTK